MSEMGKNHFLLKGFCKVSEATSGVPQNTKKIEIFDFNSWFLFWRFFPFISLA